MHQHFNTCSDTSSLLIHQRLCSVFAIAEALPASSVESLPLKTDVCTPDNDEHVEKSAHRRDRHAPFVALNRQDLQ